ncbi:NADH-quinone oxidoreductase subunit J [Sterolibacterium denitrificans]|uniref:NADH-quinone oxidoreductase subunit J n=1 Tax=Sterolibacterium denitrificans TaxID=157592 RepID=A0A7Z7MUU9_9PROT|nr:NADH-quinone oxidoreductase subunit J [Sterolibacterium denitrificans]SMB24727.1 NADH-quinone oxidoreductase subunit J [Sterolibacterium denitrificans]
MDFKIAIFYFLAAVMVFAALRVITARNPVHAVLFLVMAFFNAAGIWLLLQAEFLAIVLVMVYVGAVMVLFLFVVMMIDINIERLREGFWRYLPLGALIGGFMVLEMALVLGGSYFSAGTMPAPAELAADFSNTKQLGRLLFTEYVYPFELASVVLLVAIIAAVMITHRRRSDRKSQRVPSQVAASKSERLRLVNMPSEQESPAAAAEKE